MRVHLLLAAQNTHNTHTYIGFPCSSAIQLPWLPWVIKGANPYLFASFIISKALSVPRHKIIVKWIKCETERAFHSAGPLGKLSNQARWSLVREYTTSILKKASEALCRENKTCSTTLWQQSINQDIEIDRSKIYERLLGFCKKLLLKNCESLKIELFSQNCKQFVWWKLASG